MMNFFTLNHTNVFYRDKYSHPSMGIEMVQIEYVAKRFSRISLWLTCLLIVLTVQLQAQVTVTATAGTTGPSPYSTLKDAFDAVNAGTHLGNITISLTGNTTETASAVLNASGTGSSSYTSLTIVPSGGAARTITGAIVGHLIDLDGADNVTIDGQNSGGNSLTISNTGLGASSAIRLANDASNNIINRCTVQSSTAVSFGVITFGTGTTTGNDNNTISNCNITTASGTDFPLNGIYSLGSASPADNSNNSVTNNNISDFFNAASATNGIQLSTGNTGWIITNNKFFQTATRTYTTGSTHNGINISSGDGYTITGNTIGYASAGGTGTYTMAGTVATRFIAIGLGVGTANPTTVDNNTFTAFNLATSSGANITNGIICGINVTSGNVNIGTDSGNTIGGSSGANLIVGTSTTSGGLVVGINSSSTGTIPILKNTIGGLTSSGTTAAIAGNITGILVSGAATSISILNNTIGNATTDNMRGGTSGLTTGSSLVSGINLPSIPTTATIIGNTIQNLASYGTGTTGFVRGIWTALSSSATATGWSITNNTINNLTTNAALAGVSSGVCSALGIHHLSSQGCVISQNTISNISNINTTATTQIVVAGIMSANATQTTPLGVEITRNRIWNLSNTTVGTTITAPPMVIGIGVRSGNSVTAINNNMISIGSGQTTNTTFIGIWSNNGSTPNPTSTNIYNNSVVIDGMAASGALPSFCYLRGQMTTTVTTVTVDIRNNIFDNRRTGSTGTHYAIANNYGSTVSTTGWGANASNFNMLNAPDPSAIGHWTNNRTFADWQTASASDANSYSGFPVIFADASNGDLHLNMGLTPTVLESGAQTIAGINIDFDGQTRPGPPGSVNGGGTFPDIGADEFDGVVLDISPPIITYTPLSNNCSIGARMLTATITDASGVPTAGIGLPVLYWRINAGAYSPATGVSLGGGQYQFTLGTGSVIGDMIGYYIVAQDNAGTPNVGAFPSAGAGGFTANPPAVATPPTTPSSYTNLPALTGIKTVGVGGDYTTLTDAVAAYNSSCISGAVVFSLIDPTYPSETFPIVINQNAAASAVNTLTIRPASGVSPAIAGTVTGALIRVLGNYVTIDGSNNGTNTRNLTITQNGTTSPSVLLIGSTGTTPVTNVTVKNCVLTNGVNTSTALVVSDATTLGNDGYFNNISLINNVVQKAYMGMYIRAFAQPGNGSGLLVKDNNMTSTGANAIRYIGIYIQGVDGGIVEKDTLGNFDATSNEDDKGIWLATGSKNFNVLRNHIFNLGHSGTGGYGGHGIYVSSGLTGANIQLANNMIANMFGDGWNYTSVPTDNPIGVVLTGTQDGISVYYNSINLSGNTLNQTSAMSMGIYLGAGSVANIRDNIIVNNLGLLGATGYGSCGIYAVTSNGQFTAINYNDYYVQPTGSGVKFIGQIAATGHATLADWQGATGQDANSLNVQPNFLSSTDLHLDPSTNPLLDGAATSIVGITTDFDGDARNASTPDIGADEFVSSGPCAGTPNPGATQSTASQVCSGVNFTLSLSNSPIPGTGITYQWQSSPNGSTWTDINGATSSTLTTNQSVATWYQCVVTCTNSSLSANSTPLQITMSSILACYCPSTYANGCGLGDEIQEVTLDGAPTMNNMTGCGTGAYTYFTPTPTTNLVQGITYNLAIKMGSDANQYAAAWIDFNKDGILDASENIGISGNGGANGTVTLTFTVPITAMPGLTRLRIRGGNDSALTDAQACGASSSAYGETEDYDITIIAGNACSGTPVPGNTLATANSVCAGIDFTLSLSNTFTETGITYQWQSSPDGSMWTDVSGAMSATLTTSQTSTTWYQCVVTCTNSGQSANSAPLQVTMDLPSNCYCAAGATNTSTSFEKISRVEFNTIDNTSTSSAGYEDFISVSTTVNPGSTYAFTGTISNPWQDDQIIVWIDSNQDGVFNNLDEQVFTSSLGNGPHSGNITIPLTAMLGTTRMRIRLHDALDGPNSTPCGNSTYGQVEDYTVIISGCTPVTWYQDADNDTYGNPGVSVMACNAPMGYVADNTDCNDNNANVFPGATEICNGIDDDCDGQTDEGVLLTFYADTDNDTYGDPNVSVQACSAPMGYVTNNTDCNDMNANVYPGAPEICNNSMDDDCDGTTDEALITWTGAGDGINWTDGNNWNNGGAVPQVCNDIVIPAGSNVTVPAGASVVGKTLQVDLTAVLTMVLTAVMTIVP